MLTAQVSTEAKGFSPLSTYRSPWLNARDVRLLKFGATPGQAIEETGLLARCSATGDVEVFHYWKMSKQAKYTKRCRYA